jgi:hypothetical protein
MQRLILAALVFISTGYAAAKDQVPFRGTWEGSTVSATPIDENVVLVVSSGSGHASHLGRFDMTSPHLTFLDTGAVEGTQIFTAANGDTLTATITGQFVPNEEGNLEATLAGTITGGTGRFQNASGSYDFHIIARPAEFGFDSSATFSGTISTVGSNKKK